MRSALALVALCGHAAAAATKAAFVKAADMSQLPDFDCYGACNKYRVSSNSPPTDAISQLAQFGLTHVRSRIWVNPTPFNATYANLTGVLGLARRINAAGMKLWLDVHYSDWWADPGQQHKPAAWMNMSIADLAQAVSTFTASTLAALVAQGTPPDIVQVGNEINNGMLWPEAWQDCSDSGALFKPGCSAVTRTQGNWPNFGSLVAAGLAQVRALTPHATVMIHTALGPDLAAPAPRAYIAGWYANLTAALSGVDYDAVGLSCYPFWGFGNTTNFAHVADLLALLPPGKQVFVAETAFPYSSPQPGVTYQYPVTPAGQAQFVQAALANAQAGGAAGLAWWGTEYTQGSGAGLTGLWDEEYTALPALTQGWK